MAQTEQNFRELLSEGLDLCVRARKLDAIERRNNTLAISKDAEEWLSSGAFDRHVERHNAKNPDAPISTRSATVALWVQEQYDTDLANWERRTRRALMEGREE